MLQQEQQNFQSGMHWCCQPRAFLFWTIAICNLIIDSNGYRFLFLWFHGDPSHRKSMLPTAEALAKKGHHVVLWDFGPTPSTEKNKYVAEDIQIGITFDRLIHGINMSNIDDDPATTKMIWEMQGMGPMGNILPWAISIEACNRLLAQKREELEKIAGRTWDLIVHDVLFCPCGFAVTKLNQAPVLFWGTSLPSNTIVESRMQPANPSFIPTESFIHRLVNVRDYVLCLLGQVFIEFAMIRRSGVAEIVPEFRFAKHEGDAVFGLSQQPMEFEFPQPLLPDFVRLGEICKAPGNLSKDMNDFVNDPASAGTIVIAFGHFANWHGAPEQALAAFGGALKRLKNYRIIWRCNVPEAVDDTNRHIRRLEWVPQNELLHHPKTKLFVTHAGMKSVMESGCASVPMVSMPFFAEQYRNTALLEVKGIGAYLEKSTLTEDMVYDTIMRVLKNDSYARSIRKFRREITDKVIPAENYATFLLEFAARRGKRLHLLRNKAVNLSYLKYYCLDIFLFVIGLIFSLIYSLVRLYRYVAY